MNPVLSVLGTQEELESHIGFLHDLQAAHDDGITPEEMKRNLRRVAFKYKLADLND